MLTRNVQRTLEIPNEPGQTMTIQQLGWLALSKAEEARSSAALRSLNSMGAEMFGQLTAQRQADPAKVAEDAAATDPLLKYDRQVLLYQGIVGWSYDEPVTHDAIDSLDEATAVWAARLIAGLGEPPSNDETAERFLASPTSSTAATPSHPTNGSSA